LHSLAGDHLLVFDAVLAAAHVDGITDRLVEDVRQLSLNSASCELAKVGEHEEVVISSLSAHPIASQLELEHLDRSSGSLSLYLDVPRVGALEFVGDLVTSDRAIDRIPGDLPASISHLGQIERSLSTFRAPIMNKGGEARDGICA